MFLMTASLPMLPNRPTLVAAEEMLRFLIAKFPPSYVPLNAVIAPIGANSTPAMSISAVCSQYLFDQFAGALLYSVLSLSNCSALSTRYGLVAVPSPSNGGFSTVRVTVYSISPTVYVTEFVKSCAAPLAGVEVAPEKHTIVGARFVKSVPAGSSAVIVCAFWSIVAATPATVKLLMPVAA